MQFDTVFYSATVNFSLIFCFFYIINLSLIHLNCSLVLNSDELNDNIDLSKIIKSQVNSLAVKTIDTGSSSFKQYLRISVTHFTIF